MTKQTNVAVLGGGTGGYIAAIAAAQAGLEVVVIEREQLGGTCLHRGCIPTKALLRSAEAYVQAQDSSRFGVVIEGVSLNFERVQQRKQEVVEQLHRGIQFLMKKYNIEVIYGNGRVMGPSIFSPQSGSVAVELPDEESLTIVPQHLIIATGSRPRQLQGLAADGQRIVTSDEALQWTELPCSVIIVGGGVIGVEWASMLADFGTEVIIVEAGARLVPTEDEDVAKELARQLKKRGVRIHTNTKLQVESVHTDDDAIHISAEVAEGKELLHLSAEKLLVSVGRQANVDGIGLENTGVQLENGFIRVNESMQTSEPHIYAIGDVIGGLQLAHAASAEGRVAVEHLTGGKPEALDKHRIPRCIYSRPEAAAVGMTEHEARQAGIDVRIGKVSFKAIGKAVVQGETDGFVKVVMDAATNDLLGVHIVGPHATELIGEAALAKLLDATPWEVGHVIHPHPSLSEIMSEAMWAAEGRAYHG
ncbi:dihydrolipoyl dehydrogenase [Paenibacillus sp. 481]|uniref:dihydrolipoyl dehydrogenase n=1 Tax=Paenibacillus sp. 481 TaxID=2835869 RepID=UPI001E402703|nr:dihydrolipoyl dehydrogenase [Paenibacillus sp. 481]UHA72896.1 dihydrolipoyl dehydrogenase [Paenibacillus sp. 481]